MTIARDAKRFVKHKGLSRGLGALKKGMYVLSHIDQIRICRDSCVDNCKLLFHARFDFPTPNCGNAKRCPLA